MAAMILPRVSHIITHLASFDVPKVSRKAAIGRSGNEARDENHANRWSKQKNRYHVVIFVRMTIS
jgi:hypothetical protein